MDHKIYVLIIANKKYKINSVINTHLKIVIKKMNINMVTFVYQYNVKIIN